MVHIREKFSAHSDVKKKAILIAMSKPNVRVIKNI